MTGLKLAQLPDRVPVKLTIAVQPDLILQLGRHVGRDFERRGLGPVEVRADTLVSLNGRRHRGRSDSGGPAGHGPQRLTAPMPGKIVRLLVTAGDTVEARQPLVVIEAMKMENELRAAGAGRVSDVHVREGQLVEAGAVLMVITDG